MTPLSEDPRSPTPSGTTAERRQSLIEWICERPAHDGLTATEIADVSGIYSGHYRASRCFDDLLILHGQNRVERVGRPARWFASEDGL